MATVIKMPKIGMSVESCIITKWHKKKGDTVKVGDLLFSYETDKASVDEEAKVDGVLLETFANEGDDVPVLENVCVIGSANEDISSLIPNATAPEPIVEEVKPAKVEEKVEVTPVVNNFTAPVSSNGGVLKISPRARTMADKAGIDIRFVTPTGPEGRIIERDIRNAMGGSSSFTKAAMEMNTDATVVLGTGIGGKATVVDVINAVPVPATEVYTPAAEPVKPIITAPVSNDYQAVKISNVRKFIAKAMQSSLNNSAQLTLNLSFDATKMLSYRKMLKENGSDLGLSGITLNDMILFAVSRTLKNHKDLNAHLVDDTMLYFNSVNLGIAVDTDKGLMVPTLFGADKMSLSEISNTAKQIITASQNGTISPDFLKGATFTITNLGTLDIESFTPVINPPQTGILGICTIENKIKEVDGKFVSYPSMGLSLTFDHRALDGAPAARFLKELKLNLENFGILLAL